MAIEHRKRTILHIVVLFIIVACGYSPLLKLSTVGGDMSMTYWPARYFLSSEIRGGHFPLWNPYQFCGYPFIADVAAQTYYPITLLGSLLGKYSFYELQMEVIFHYFLAAVFMYLLVRYLTRSDKSALLCGLIYPFSAVFTRDITHILTIYEFAWLPMVLYCFLRMFDEKSLRRSIIAGLVLGITILAGHPTLTLGILILLTFIFLIHIYLQFEKNRQFEFPIKLTLLFALAVITGFLISSVQMLPLYEAFTKHSTRAQISYGFARQGTFAPRCLLRLLIPNIPLKFGDYGSKSYAYIGIMPLLLAFIGAIYHRGRHILWCIICIGFFTVLSFGQHSFLHRLMFEFVPGCNKFRMPGLFFGFSMFGMILLSGFGYSYILQKTDKSNGQGLTSLLGWLSKGVLLLVALSISSFPVIYCMEKGDTSRIFEILDPTILFFVFLIAALILMAMLCKKNFSNETLHFFICLIIVVDLLTAGFPLLTLYKKSSIPDTRTKITNFVRHNTMERRSAKFRNQAGLLKEFDTLGRVSIKLQRYDTFYKLISHNPKLQHLLATKDSLLPRNFVMDKVVVKSPNEIKEILKKGFNPSKCVLLEREAPAEFRNIVYSAEKIVLYSEAIEPLQLQQEIKIESCSPNRIDFRVDTESNGILFTSETFYPGWKAFIDGVPVEVFRANYAFRAVFLKAGSHGVSFVFAPIEFRVGLLITLGALLISILILWKTRPKSNKKSGVDNERTG